MNLPVVPRIRRPARTRRDPLRRAFTLLEVILALALTVGLAFAVSTAISNYARISTSGTEDVKRAQLARALLQKIRSDLQCVVFQPPEPIAADAASGQAADDLGALDPLEPLAAEELTVDPETAYTAPQGGVFGTESMLVVHVSRPSRELNNASLYDGDAARSRTSDLRSVVWFLAVANAGGLEGAVGNLASGGSVLFSRESGAQGIARLDGDRLAVGLADADQDLRTLASGTEVLAEEVALLQFRYFDGVAWQYAWDSAALGRLPQAVEVVLGFHEPDPANPSGDPAASPNLGIENIGQVYRTVISLPLAQPLEW